MRFTDLPIVDTEDRTKTRQTIKVAARRLFAERGVEAVSVREIVAAAGAKNGGSLNYYFKSKEGLILELLTDLFQESSRAWLDGLSGLEKRGGAKCVRDIVEVVVLAPDTDTFSDPAPTSARFLASVLFTRRKMTAEFLEQMNFSVFGRLLQYIGEVRSDIPGPVMRQRLIYFAWYVLSVRAAHEAWVASRKRSEIWSGYDPLLNLVESATGLLEAGYTDAEEAAAAAPKKPRRAPRAPKKPAS